MGLEGLARVGQPIVVWLAPFSSEVLPRGGSDAPFKGGARGCLYVSQINAGRKNCLRYEIAATKCTVAWNSEEPNTLWIGDRDEPNESLVRDPALLGGLARGFANYPGGHAEGFPDTFKQCFRARSTRPSRAGTPARRTSGRDVWKHVLAVWDHRNDDNVLVLCFETMKADLGGTIEKVAQFRYPVGC